MSPTGTTPRAALDLLSRFRGGDRVALARAISLIENEAPGYRDFLRAVYPDAGRAYLVGVTGPPGAGKSTLVARLATSSADAGLSVGIIAVDPTSPFTGGALLGDRIRMQEAAGNERVFIRSMATRGSMGGLAKATREAAVAMDAFGFDLVVLETVGVGQSELDVAGAADTTVVVVVPESGDAVQAMKAGLMEIADVLAVNKADRDGADLVARELRVTLDLKPGDGWRPPVVMTVGTEGRGVAELVSAIAAHRAYLEETGEFRRRRRARVRREVEEMVRYDVGARLAGAPGYDEMITRLAAEVGEGRLTPFEAAEQLMDNFFGGRR